MSEARRPEDVSLPRSSKGQRPNFFDDPSIDQMMTFFFELMTEVAVMRERLGGLPDVDFVDGDAEARLGA